MTETCGDEWDEDDEEETHVCVLAPDHIRRQAHECTCGVTW